MRKKKKTRNCDWSISLGKSEKEGPVNSLTQFKGKIQRGSNNAQSIALLMCSLS